MMAYTQGKSRWLYARMVIEMITYTRWNARACLHTWEKIMAVTLSSDRLGGSSLRWPIPAPDPEMDLTAYCFAVRLHDGLK